jgi:hypothetical protein
MTRNPVILAGDVGGTTTDVALLDERLAFRVIRSYPSREYGSLNDIVREFLRVEAPRVTHACFGIAGPVRDGSVRTTNLPWVVEASDLARLMGRRATSTVCLRRRAHQLRTAGRSRDGAAALSAGRVRTRELGARALWPRVVQRVPVFFGRPDGSPNPSGWPS